MERFLRGRRNARNFGRSLIHSVGYEGHGEVLDERGRFRLEFSSPPKQGAYGEVSFVRTIDSISGTKHHYIIKRSKEETPGEALVVTELEYKILCGLAKRDLPVPDPEGVDGDYIIMTYVSGGTLDAMISNSVTLNSRLGIIILDSMKEIRDALKEMDESGEFSPAEREYLMQRKYAPIRKVFPQLTEEQVEKEYYSYRILAKLGVLLPEFLESYKEVNDTLRAHEDSWVSFDHPGNRIVCPEPLECVLRYDFNQVVRGFYGLDVASFVAGMGREAMDGERRMLNVLHLAVLEKHGVRDRVWERLRELPVHQVELSPALPPEAAEDVNVMGAALYHRTLVRHAERMGWRADTAETRERVESALLIADVIQENLARIGYVGGNVVSLHALGPLARHPLF